MACFTWSCVTVVVGDSPVSVDGDAAGDAEREPDGDDASM